MHGHGIYFQKEKLEAECDLNHILIKSKETHLVLKTLSETCMKTGLPPVCVKMCCHFKAGPGWWIMDKLRHPAALDPWQWRGRGKGDIVETYMGKSCYVAR
ncbi:hypothetical protein COCON_G00207000 [Conger conger]|uniref:Uncharacterized protein n=1 Tax=Conger conger TaxID=82655 RepID=A0A9Q1D0D1_CONCO|nr:hypothetical protein COCON_G00207000 [Conger conger]